RRRAISSSSTGAGTRSTNARARCSRGGSSSARSRSSKASPTHRSSTGSWRASSGSSSRRRRRASPPDAGRGCHGARAPVAPAAGLIARSAHSRTSIRRKEKKMRSIPCLAFITLVLAACATGGSREDGVQPLRVASERTVTGFGFPESVGCDVEHNVLYVSQFGGTEPKPPAKDGLGYISKVAPDGTVIEKRAFDVTMNKPKGIWIQGTRLWVTDIDSLWIFDTVTKQSRRLEIPGMEFANDVALMDGAAYVSDNRNDELFRVAPADFLDASVQPEVRALWKGGSIFPNGLWPTKEGLLMVGFQSADKPRGIYVMGRDGAITQMSQPI